MSDAGEQSTRKPGRKAETPTERLARLERDLALAKEAVREAEQRQAMTVGRAVLEEAAGDAALMKRVQDILRRRVVSKAGRAAIAALIGSGEPLVVVTDSAAPAANGS